MNYFFIAFASLLTITTILYVIFYFNNVKIGTLIISCIHLPLLTGSSISILIHLLPDANRIGTFLTLILIFGTIGTIFNQFEKQKFLILSIISFCISLSICELLTGSIFILYHVPSWIIIPALLLLAAILTTVIIFSKKQKYYYYLMLLILFSLSIFFIICTLFNLIAYKNVSSILLFTGSIEILLFTVFYSLNLSKFKLKVGNFINHMALVSLYCLIASGFIMMLF